MARLPRTIDELRTLMDDFSTEESVRRADAVEIKRDDVLISTYPKSGTTWLQQVAHQLRSGGDMDFEEISVAVPWLDVAHDMGIDPEAQPWRPRVFKLHRSWDELPRGGRVITAFRSPASVLRSFYRFFSGAFFEPGSISVEDFTHRWFLEGSGSGLYFDHLVSFWPHVREPGVLALSYEDMTAAPERVVRIVADFIGIEDPAAIDVAITNSSRALMAAHPEKFDDHVLSQAIHGRTGVPIGTLAKVHAASPEIELTRDLHEAIQAKWDAIVREATGFATYAELRNAMPDHLGVRSPR